MTIFLFEVDKTREPVHDEDGTILDALKIENNKKGKFLTNFMTKLNNNKLPDKYSQIIDNETNEITYQVKTLPTKSGYIIPYLQDKQRDVIIIPYEKLSNPTINQKKSGEEYTGISHYAESSSRGGTRRRRRHRRHRKTARRRHRI